MDINNLILTDEALNVIDNGAWFDDFEEAPGLRLKVRGLQSDASRDLLNQKQAQARAKNRNKPLTDKQLAHCTREVLHEVVLLDWDGLKDGDKPIKYSQELAKKWIMSRNGERFAGLVIHAAQQIDAQAGDFVEEVTKN